MNEAENIRIGWERGEELELERAENQILYRGETSTRVEERNRCNVMCGIQL